MKALKRSVWIAWVLLISGSVAPGQIGDPFSVSVDLSSQEGGTRVSVAFAVPGGHYLYAGKITVSAGSGVLRPLNHPKGKEKDDEFFGRVLVFEQDVALSYILEDHGGGGVVVTVDYQGCSASLCYPPTTRRFELSPSGGGGVLVPEAQGSVSAGSADAAWRELAQGFTIVGRQGGYMRPEPFLEFLEAAKQRQELEKDTLGSLFRKSSVGAVVAVLLIVLGGLGLNLTPCVLPMIPINIAIIGAGGAAGSKGRGFALGGAYGSAMAVVYGGLGLLVVKTGAKFGSLNSSVWFNGAVAAVFILLGLAMFDVISIDLSRFQGKVGGNSKSGGGFLTAFLMGGVAALLAGACVAPVVMSVLLLSTDLYAGGQMMGLLLPFLLGVGMGLPWPFLGAGLSFMPKPGGWMVHVKHAFGVLIIAFAVYYGIQAGKLLKWQAPGSRKAVEQAQGQMMESGEWMTSLPEALAEAKRTGKPVFIDFWASWCKNCLAMEKTFKHPDVKAALGACVNVKFRAEVMDAPGTKEILDYFRVPGLPTYVVLKPKAE